MLLKWSVRLRVRAFSLLLYDMWADIHREGGGDWPTKIFGRKEIMTGEWTSGIRRNLTTLSIG